MGKIAHARPQPGWRSGIVIWACICLAVLLANLIFLIWALARPSPTIPGATPDSSPVQPSTSDGTNVFEGDCEQVSRLKNWAHILLNVLGSLILIASANCMQCLSSPTREEIDAAHLKGVYLDIGILSLRNLRHIAPKRRILWAVLALSSVPFHLIYNSVIFSSLSTRDYITGVIPTDYLRGAILNHTSMETNVHTNSSLMSGLDQSFDHLNHCVYPNQGVDVSDVDLYKCIVNNPADLINVVAPVTRSTVPAGDQFAVRSSSIADCVKTFDSHWIGSVSSVLFIANTTKPRWLGSAGYMTWTDEPPRWMCGAIDPYANYTTSMQGTAELTPCDEGVPKAQGLCGGGSGQDCSQQGSCIVQPAPEHCTVELSESIMIVALVSLFAKIAVMLWTAKYLRFEPIITAGDAIRTFLTSPDPTTASMGPVSSYDIKRILKLEKKKLLLETSPREYRRKHILWDEEQPRWFYSASILRWWCTLGMCFIVECIGIGILVISLANGSLADSVRAGFGAVDTSFYSHTAGVGNHIVLLALACNLPQMAVSLVYMVYYTLLSSMLVSSEMSTYAHKRHTLRVSPPRMGGQRSTYWLSAPLRYSVPLLGATTLLHWFLSQSIFVVRVNQVLLDGTKHFGIFSGFGYSPVAIVAAIALGAAFAVLPLVLSFRHMPGGIPIMDHNSLAVSAACHRDAAEPEDAAQKPLMYGELPTRGKTGVARAGFSSLEVGRLRAEVLYEGSYTTTNVANVADEWTDVAPKPVSGGWKKSKAVDSTPLMESEDLDYDLILDPFYDWEINRKPSRQDWRRS